MKTKQTFATTTVLLLAAVPFFTQQPALASEVAGPATCYVADENDSIIEPRQEYKLAKGAAELHAVPSPVVPGTYTLQTSAPGVNFDPDNPDVHIVCEVRYSALGNIRLVDSDGSILASVQYKNDLNNPSRAATTDIPEIPNGYEIVPGQSIFGLDAEARTLDPNKPSDARAIGLNTDIMVRKVSQSLTPTPSTSKPPAPTDLSTPTIATPTPSAPTPVESTPSQQLTQSPKKPSLAKTGAESGILVTATLVATAGAMTFSMRKRHA